MKKIAIKTSYKKMLADTTTPVSIYLRLRDIFPNSILLESSDYHSRENNMSYVCCDPIAGIELDNKHLHLKFPDGTTTEKPVDNLDLIKEVATFRKAFHYEEPKGFKFISNGLFGYFAFEAVEYFEDIKLKTPKNGPHN